VPLLSSRPSAFILFRIAVSVGSRQAKPALTRHNASSLGDCRRPRLPLARLIAAVLLPLLPLLMTRPLLALPLLALLASGLVSPPVLLPLPLLLARLRLLVLLLLLAPQRLKCLQTAAPAAEPVRVCLSMFHLAFLPLCFEVCRLAGYPPLLRRSFLVSIFLAGATNAGTTTASPTTTGTATGRAAISFQPIPNRCALARDRSFAALTRMQRNVVRRLPPAAATPISTDRSRTVATPAVAEWLYHYWRHHCWHSSLVAPCHHRSYYLYPYYLYHYYWATTTTGTTPTGPTTTEFIATYRKLVRVRPRLLRL
jgi:hypothetical protein